MASVCSLTDLLYVGRFVAAKGVLDLVDAVSRLPKENLARLRLTLAGNLNFSDIAYVEEIRRRIKLHSLSRNIQFLGTVDGETLERLFRRAHILVIPSYHEGFCKPVIEGLRAGCIPVGYRSYGLPPVGQHHIAR